MKCYSSFLLKKDTPSLYDKVLVFMPSLNSDSHYKVNGFVIHNYLGIYIKFRIKKQYFQRSEVKTLTYDGTSLKFHHRDIHLHHKSVWSERQLPHY